MFGYSNKIRFILVAILALFFTGCDSFARVDYMVVNGSKYAAREPLTKGLKNNISVINVSSLKNNYPIGISEIGDTQFKIALEKSLLEASLLNAIPKYSEFHLSAKLLEVEQPGISLDFTVSASVQYELVETSSGAVVYSEKITKPYTSYMKDSFVSFERLRFANEGAAKANIEEVIKRLYNIKI